MTARTVERLVEGQATSDGAGVRLTRVIGSSALDHLDPFLLLDEFRSDDPNDYIAGFPDHPHRGFETVTYMLAGAMEHRDHVGNRGLLKGGGAQWMTAGRGIIHSEMPRQENGLMWGFQLWVNLPGRLKMSPPRYQDIEPASVPVVALATPKTSTPGEVRVLAGSFGEATGPVEGISTEPLYLDVRLEPNEVFRTSLQPTHTAFIYGYRGRGACGATALEVQRLGVLSPGDSVEVRADEDGYRFLLVAAQPLNEPIARYGPFVMNTKAEIAQAFADYRAGRLAS
jgi:hypothetical protein